LEEKTQERPAAKRPCMSSSISSESSMDVFWRERIPSPLVVILM
jgi:hypothetical protein